MDRNVDGWINGWREGWRDGEMGSREIHNSKALGGHQEFRGGRAASPRCMQMLVPGSSFGKKTVPRLKIDRKPQ